MTKLEETLDEILHTMVWMGMLFLFLWVLGAI